MKILFLTQIVPYPPDSGPKVKTWQVLRYLHGCGHQITLLSFVRKEEEKYLPEIEKLGIRVFGVPMRRSRLMDVFYLARSILTGESFLITRDNLPEMRSQVSRLLADGAFDAIHADQLTMTQFALNTGAPQGSRAPVRVFDAHNATWMIAKRMGENFPRLFSPLFALEARRIRQYEGRVVREFEHTLAVTDIDRDLLLQAVPGGAGAVDRAARKILSIPITVDAEKLALVRRAENSHNILTLGTLHYPPNADGIRWFFQQVFPQVRQLLPGATLTIVGKNPPADFLQTMQQNPGVIDVTGYVDDLTPYLERACLMVVPVRVGSGMRVRILEALARGIPVVTTTIGLEGIDAQPGEEVLVADEPADFAQAVARLAADPDLQARLRANGRRLVEQVYDWKAALQKMNKIYDR